VDTAAFDYDLPADRIAQVPVEPRDAARLLVDRGAGQAPEHRHVRDLPDLLVPGDLLVVNDTRVLPARVHLRKETGGAVEVLLLEPVQPDQVPDPDEATADRDDAGWEALVRPSRKVPDGTALWWEPPAGAAVPPGAPFGIEVLEDRGDGRRRVRVRSTAGDAATTRVERRAADLDALAAMGELPLPPYIAAAPADTERYQTVYARRAASAAAPTAGLHLTPGLLDALRGRGVQQAQVELVVGIGTFRPITAARVEDHHMHRESYAVPEETWEVIRTTKAAGGSVVAVGTTVVRALESAAATGRLTGGTELFIQGDYPFAVVDRLLTNFHLPRSSLLVLIDAFAGPHWRELYATAARAEYRFLSFGDAMLLDRRSSSGPVDPGADR
jgi:S-adenosylmethionine:tRNA ribosyltransferase-isomerase